MWANEERGRVHVTIKIRHDHYFHFDDHEASAALERIEHMIREGFKDTMTGQNAAQTAIDQIKTNVDEIAGDLDEVLAKLNAVPEVPAEITAELQGIADRTRGIADIVPEPEPPVTPPDEPPVTPPDEPPVTPPADGGDGGAGGVSV